MSSNSSPGVYTRELDLSQRIRAVSTSIGAIVGASTKGPLNERVLVTNEQEFISAFGKPNPRTSYMHYAALEFLSKSSRLYVTRVVNDDENNPQNRPLTAGAYYVVDDSAAINPRPRLSVFDDGSSNAQGIWDPYNTLTWNPNTPGIQNALFMVCAQNPGDWNNSIYVSVRPSQKAGTSGFDEAFDDPYAFYVDVYLNYTSPNQRPDETFLVKREYDVDGYGNQLYLEEVINNSSKIIRVRNNPYAPTKVKVLEEAHVFFAGATNGSYVTYGQMIRAWDLYKDVESVDVNILIQGGAPVGMSAPQDIADIQRAMATLAQDRKDCIAVLDIPSTRQETAQALAYRRQELNLDSNYAAIYSPDVRIRDKYNDLDVWVPPSGFAAAAYAYTDEVAEAWFAPAGMSRGTLDVQESRFIYNQGHRDALDDGQINAIRFFPNGSGYKIWGAATMQVMASALSNVHVRRLLNYIEKSISIAAQYSVFDPNDEVLWARLRDMCTRFLTPIQHARGLYWFSVVCDGTNNKAETIAAGDLFLDVYLDPVMFAKRIYLNAILTKTGQDFQELIQERS